MNAMAPAPKPPSATIDGSHIALIPSGRDRLSAILDLIDGAKTSLNLLFYMFTPDEGGERIRDALVQAAGRGVAVKVLLDRFGCGTIKSEFLEPLKMAGGHYCVFHPSLGRRYLIRNHQKMAIADGEVALIGRAHLNAQNL